MDPIPSFPFAAILRDTTSTHAHEFDPLSLRAPHGFGMVIRPAYGSPSYTQNQQTVGGANLERRVGLARVPATMVRALGIKSAFTKSCDAFNDEVAAAWEAREKVGLATVGDDKLLLLQNSHELITRVMSLGKDLKKEKAANTRNKYEGEWKRRGELLRELEESFVVTRADGTPLGVRIEGGEIHISDMDASAVEFWVKLVGEGRW